MYHVQGLSSHWTSVFWARFLGARAAIHTMPAANRNCYSPASFHPAQLASCGCAACVQDDAPALVLQDLAVKLGPTFVKLAQTLR